MSDIIPGTKVGAFAVKWILIGVAGLIAIALVGGFLTNPFHWKEKLAQSWRTKAEVAEAQGAISAGEVQVGQQSLDAIAAAARADQQTRNIRMENRDAILAAPGADPPIDLDLARTFSDGLCRYDAYKDDPGCDRLYAVSPDLEAADPGGAEAEPR